MNECELAYTLHVCAEEKLLHVDWYVSALVNDDYEHHYEHLKWM